MDNNTVVFASSKDSQQTFTYDHVFGMDTSQLELYNQTVAPLLNSFMKGYK